MRISDWSSDVCSSDLYPFACTCHSLLEFLPTYSTSASARRAGGKSCRNAFAPGWRARRARVPPASLASPYTRPRSEEHTSELQSLMRISYAVFCLKKQKKHLTQNGVLCNEA